MSIPNKHQIMDIDAVMMSATASAPPPEYEESIPLTTITQPEMDDKRRRLNELCRTHDISPMFASLLWNLNEKHIIFLCDDSGSMNSAVEHGKSRWDELKDVITEVLDISLIFDPVGMDVHFLNRAPVMNVRNKTQIVNQFTNPPSGGTSLVAKLNEIARMYQSQASSQPVPAANLSKLLIISTDGEPTDDCANYPRLKTIIQHLIEHGYHIAFLICTDDDRQVAYINEIDKQYQTVDAVDDYYTERQQIMRVQGPKFKFSYGDYIVKLLVGSIVSTLDTLDEVKVKESAGTARRYTDRDIARERACACAIL